ncbi:MAG TPA: flagella basal body P-ring formation protein FlgA [Gemmatimonadaceae bacterium]|nr:flagella basal body P-ring formation protein FlgA [Gemmatimonadaceae bacterium]
MTRIVRQLGVQRRHAAGRVLVACVAAAQAAPGFAAESALAPGREPLRIELRQATEVKGPQVLLGDVAVLTTLDLPLLERLMVLPVGPAPRTGTSARLERAALLRWIRARTGLRPEQIAWSGPDAAVVRVALGRVSGEEIAGEAREALAHTIAALGLEAGIGEPLVPNDQDVPAGEVELRVRSVPRAAVLSGRPSVWVDVWVDGRFARTVPVRFEIAPGATAVAARTAPRVRTAPVPAPHSIVEPSLAVTRGSTANLRSVTGRIAVESRVEVLEDGRPGEVVRVRLPGAEAPVLARVVAPRAVEVEP